MSDSKGISIKANFDRKLIWERGRSVRYLEIDVVAPSAPTSKSKKPPLNLALVIDASGSMAGEPLECAKKAAAGVVNALTDTSKVSIISFASNVVTHVDAGSVENGERKKALSAIQELCARDSTNLGAGWLRGAECLASVMEMTTGMHNHVVLLSDGHANAGITDPMVLAHHAEQLRTRGVVTSSVGIGDSYSSSQLQALADHGGGRLHDAQFPHEIIEVVLGELNELQDTIVEDIAVTVSHPSGIRLENLSDFPTVVGSSSALTQLGMLAPERGRPVIFRVTCPEGREGDLLSFAVNCSWMPTGTTERAQCEQVSTQLRFVSEFTNSGQQRDEELSVRVAKVWQAAVVRKAVRINRQGDLRELNRYLEHESRFFGRYCEGLPGTDRLVQEIQRLKDNANHLWDERSRKNMDHSSYLSQQSHQDHRTITRSNWSDELDHS